MSQWRASLLAWPDQVWVTCYTDASWSPRKGGGWAVWLRSGQGRIVRRGPCPPYVTSSYEAELAAIFAGIYLAANAWGALVRGITVYSDCRAALEILTPEARPARAMAGRLQGKIRGLLNRYAVELETRWVKGHQPISAGTAAYLNRQCDRLANTARLAKPDEQAKPDQKKKKKKKKKRRLRKPKNQNRANRARRNGEKARAGHMGARKKRRSPQAGCQ
ncbi:MAG: RNAse HI domain-containing protein [Proteobacteria bacterium]|nr:RNAse HI domain-containing protein [Pseudomonadota bacterium]